MPKLLCVDDETLVLEALRRALRGQVDLLCATSGTQALDMLASERDISAILVDYRMPEMNGLELLEKVRERFPRVQRMMLTGEADMTVALGAVNRGSVFRFLLKPAERQELRGAIDAAFRQSELESAERELLDKTVTGSVRMLIDLLELADPQTFAQTSERRQWVRSLAKSLQLGPSWVIELAAVLGRIGELTLPPSLRERMARRSPLSGDEAALAAAVVETGAGLLERIPRLEAVAQLLRAEQQEQCSGSAMLLRICNELLRLRAKGGLASAFAALREQPARIDLPMLAKVEDLLRRQGTDRDVSVQLRLPIAEISVGDRLMEELRGYDNRLLCAALVVLGASQVQRIHNYTRLGLVGGEVLVERLRAVQEGS